MADDFRLVSLLNPAVQNVGPAISAGTQSGSTGTIVFSNSNGVSFGMSNSSVVTASVPSTAGLISNVNVSAGTTSNNLSALTFSNSNGLAFGLNASTITGSYTVPSVTNSSWTASDSVTSLTISRLAFTNSNGLTFTMSTGAGAATLIGSYNSTQFAGTGTTVAVAGGVGFSDTLNSNGLNVSVQNNPVSKFFYPYEALTAVTSGGQGSLSLQYVPILWPVTATRVDMLAAWQGTSSAASNTMAIALSAWCVIYTRNASTLTSVSSGSTQTTYSYASNTAGQTQLLTNAIRPISVPVNINATPGEYYFGMNFSTNSSSVGANTTNLAQTVSIYGANHIQTALNLAQDFGVQTSSNSGYYSGLGVFSATTNSTRGSIAVTDIVQTGASISAANIALVLRNN